VPWWQVALPHAGVTITPYPTLRQILLLSCIAFPVAQLFIYPLLGEDSPHAGMVAVELFLVWLVVLLVRRQRWSAEDVLLLNAVPLTALWVAGISALGAALLATQFDQLCSEVLTVLGWQAPAQLLHVLVRIQLITDPTSALVVVFAVIIIPAVCEEVFFRGFVFTGLRYHHGPATAIIGSALLFAAAHLNPWQFPALLFLGLFLGALVHWTHSLYPSLLGHAAINSLSVTAINLRTHTGTDVLGAVDPVPLMLLLGAGLSLVAGIRWLRQSPPIMPILSPYTRPAPADGPADAWR